MALSDNLVLYFKLDEASGNAIEAVGGNDLTDNNSVGTTTGKINGARHFTRSSSQYFTHGDNTDFSIGDIDWTLAAWVKYDSLVRGIIAGKDTGASGEFYLFLNTSASNQFEFQVYGTSGFGSSNLVRSTTFGAPSTGTFYYVVIIHDSVNNQIRICFNAGTQDSQAHSAGIFDGTGTFWIGNDSFGDLMDGAIDEMAIWKRVLSGSEITDLYNGGNGRDYTYITGGTGWGQLLGNARNRLVVIK